MNRRQLELCLDDKRVRVALVPWSGESPRDLTKARAALFLRREAQKSMRDPLQTDLFDDRSLLAEKAPWRYQGAPLLV